MKKIIHAYLMVFVILVCGAKIASAQTVTTDQSDYAPGSTVNIAGTGFAPGETVQLQVLNVTDPTDTGDEHAPWTVTADTNGNFTATWYVTDDEANMTLQLTATGLTSGLVAQATFTDSVTINSVTVGAQGGTTPVYGTADANITYTLTVNYTHTSGSTTITPTIGALPSGVSLVSFSPATQTASTGTGLITTFTLTLSTTTAAQAQTATSFTVTVTGSNGNAVNQNGALTINKATPTVTVTVGSYIYNGSAQGPNAVTFNPVGDTGTVTWSYVGVSGTTYGPSATRPTTAGSYTATASVTADSNNNAASSSATAFSIAKVTPTVTVTVGSYTYNGSAQGPNAFTTSPTGDTGTPTWSYVGVSGTTYGPSATRPTSAGSYTAQVSLAADSNNNAASSSATAFSIAKATPTATLAVNNSPVTYDGTAKAATVAITVSSVPGAVTGILTGGAATQTTANTYAVTANFVPTDTTDYNTLTAQSAGNFIINKATPTATLAVNNSPVTYDGTAKAATVAITVSSVPGAVGSILTGGAVTQTAANTYAVTANFVPTDSTDYNTLTTQSAGNFIINKATPTVTVTGTTTFTDDGTPQGPNTVTITPTDTGAVTYSYAGTGGTTYGPSATQPSFAGTFTVTAAVAADSNNNAASSSATAFTINNATSAQTDTYTTAGTTTWTAPAGVTNVTVQTWGGGGKGGTRTTTYTGGGGGGGAYSIKNTITVTPGTGYTVVVGAGATTTAAGGDSYFINTSTVLAKGGGSVANETTTGAAGGAAASGVGDTKFSGGTGANANNSGSTYGGGGGSSAGTAANGNSATVAAGATAPTGGGDGGGGFSTASTTGNGTNGVAPGGGGGGGKDFTGGTGSGGAGADGQVIITYKIPATVTLSALTQTYTGSALTPTATTVPSGLTIVWTAAPQTAAGTYSVTATINDPAYFGSASGSFVIQKVTPTVTVTGTTSFTYTGAAQGPNTYTTSPSGDTGTPTWSYVGVSGTTYGPSTTRPTSAGSYTAQVSLAADSNNNAASSSATAFSIAKVTPTISLATSSVTANGSPQAATVNGSVAGTASNVKYNGSATVPTVPGTYAVTADFAPTDSTDYNSLTGASAGNFVINPAALDHFAISAISSPQTAGTAITGITITAQDLYNNTVTSFNGAGNTVTYSGTAGITGTSATFASGVLSSVSVTPVTAGTSRTLIVTGPVGSGSKTGTSTFNVNPGAIASYTVSAAAATRGTAFNVTVTALDAGGNTVTTDNSTVVTMSATSANVQFTGNPMTLTNGTFTISTLDNYFETATVTATDANSKTGNTSVTINPVSGDYESYASGNWSGTTTWQTWSGSAWVHTTTPPPSAFTGEINVQGGFTVTVSASASVPSSLFVLNSGSTVSIANGQTLTVGKGVANGVISDGSSNNGILVESGVGNLLTLTGNNSYGGGTVISGGTVSVTNINDASGNQNIGNGGITFTNGGTLLNTDPANSSTAKAITLNSGRWGDFHDRRFHHFERCHQRWWRAGERRQRPHPSAIVRQQYRWHGDGEKQSGVCLQHRGD